LTSNVIDQHREPGPRVPPIRAFAVQGRPERAYSSSMCSKAAGRREEDGLAGRLGTAINDLADASGRLPDRELSARLAAAWALIATADPELADRTAKYSD
jgi:hypothetical protein